METRFGVQGTTTDGVFFTEATIPNATMCRRIKVEISRQNANLSQVKERMASEARNAGASAVMNFRYGQRAHPWWEMFAFKWDTESWHGEGDAVLAR
jgi:uncharacterized protein YbjQ (UPF0145 family)